MAARPSLKIEQVLFFAILLLASVFRLSRLGALPLNEHEARAALSAQNVAAGDAASTGDQTGYVILTSALFSLLPGSEFLARLWPVLFGIALVALQYFWRDLLGGKTALVLSLAFAIDPGFVSISRLASGRMIAVAALAIGFTLWRVKRPAIAGVLFAVALLSAPTIYFGVVSISLLWALFFARSIRIDRNALRSALTSAIAILVVAAVFLLRNPEGVGGIGNVLASFLSGWVHPSGTSGLLILFALVTYGLPAVIFGFLGAIRSWRQRSPLGQALSAAALINLGLVLVYPGHEVADLLWVLLPIWALAATEIAVYLAVPQDEQRAAFGEAGLMTLLLFFFLFALAKLSIGEVGLEASSPYLLLAGGVILLAALATLLIAFGWSRQAATNGLVWALALFSVLFLVSGSSRSLRFDRSLVNDLWSPGPAAGETDLIQKSVRNLSNWNNGQPASVAVDIRLNSAALAWAFRDLPSISDSPDLPALIITSATEAQPRGDSYRGQSFAYQFERSWSTLPPGLFSWLLYRKAPVQADLAILWANLSLFPDAASESLDAGGSN